MRRYGNSVVFLILAGIAPPVWGQEKAVSPSPEGSAPATPAHDQDAEDEEALRRFKEAVAALRATSDATELKRHLKVLADGFPESRAVVVEAARRDSTRVRALALKVLGDHGDVETDLDVLVAGLDDQASSVRMAAVMALRPMGKEASPAILRHLAREREPNIRKLAVRNLKTWADPDVIPPLARLLGGEKDAAVRKYMVRTLEHFSGKRYGDDSDAWLAFAEDYLYRKNEKRILEYSRSKTGKAENETKRPR